MQLSLIKLAKRLFSLLIAFGLICFAIPASSSTQTGLFGANFEVTLAGFGIAKINLLLSVENNQYIVESFAEPAFIGKLFSDHKSTFNASGNVNGQDVLPANFSVLYSEPDERYQIDMKVGNRKVISVNSEPKIPVFDDQVPITNEHHINILDPASSIMVPLIRSESGIDEKTCDYRAQVFDGWTRFDLQLSYKKHRPVYGLPGYRGDSIICSMRWIPVAGHRPHKKNVQYMANNDKIEVGLIPLYGTDFVVPYYLKVRTKLGNLKIRARNLDMTTKAAALHTTQ